MAVLTLQPDGTAGVDTAMRSGAPTGNYGTATALGIGYVSIEGSRRSLLKFDLSSLPAGLTVDSAYLNLTKDSASIAAGGGIDVVCYPLLIAWVEGTATWNNRDTGTAWNTGGADGSGTDRAASSLGSVTGVVTGTTSISIPLSATWFEDVANGITTNLGLLLLSTIGSGNNYWLPASSDHGTSGNRPQLVITYRDVLTPAVVTASPTVPAATLGGAPTTLTPDVVTASPTVPTALHDGATIMTPAALGAGAGFRAERVVNPGAHITFSAALRATVTLRIDP